MKRTIKKILQYFVCLFFSAIILTPMYLVVINSFKTKSEAARMNLNLPKEWVFDNYAAVIEKGKLLIGFGNSMLYATAATFAGVMLSAMAAFIMSRKCTKFNDSAYYFVLCGLFFPVNYVTLVRVLQTFHLSNSRMGIIITFTSAMIPFCTFTVKNFISSIPMEIDEAAIIDGVDALKLFFLVIVPLLKPTLFTCFILQFMGVWSDFLTPLYLSSRSALFPMTMAVYQFFGKNATYWNYIFADIVLTCLPVILVYLIGQKYIVGGLTSGAVKE